jgi:hypothetical protein
MKSAKVTMPLARKERKKHGYICIANIIHNEFKIKIKTVNMHMCRSTKLPVAMGLSARAYASQVRPEKINHAHPSFTERKPSILP